MTKDLIVSHRRTPEGKGGVRQGNSDTPGNKYFPLRTVPVEKKSYWHAWIGTHTTRISKLDAHFRGGVGWQILIFFQMFSGGGSTAVAVEGVAAPSAAGFAWTLVGL